MFRARLLKNNLSRYLPNTRRHAKHREPVKWVAYRLNRQSAFFCSVFNIPIDTFFTSVISPSDFNPLNFCGGVTRLLNGRFRVKFSRFKSATDKFA